jgi:hypothetical protein
LEQKKLHLKSMVNYFGVVFAFGGMLTKGGSRARQGRVSTRIHLLADSTTSNALPRFRRLEPIVRKSATTSPHGEKEIPP